MVLRKRWLQIKKRPIHPMLTNISKKQVRESRHKIDELEEKAALVDPVKANAQETELRDLRCKVFFKNGIGLNIILVNMQVEELQAGCDDRTLQAKAQLAIIQFE